MPETILDPARLALEVALEVADAPEQVGEFVSATDLGDQVTDFRFVCGIRGYEGWQWSITLYHDAEAGRWTVNESSLVPTDAALRPPAWVPWKDRLEPSDLSVTDALGTDPDDPRLEQGFRRTQATSGGERGDAGDGDVSAAGAAGGESGDAGADAGGDAQGTADATPSAASDAETGAEAAGGEGEGMAVTAPEDLDEAVAAFDLSRRHVLSQLGRAQTTKRWYEGPRGPKSLSTKTAGGNLCSDCGFFVPLSGELGLMFGVCANKWSPDDARVVSLDHGCGEHSEIEPPEPTRLWVQSKPAYDNLHIDVVAQTPREERGPVELVERLAAAGVEVAEGVIVLKSQLPA